MSTRVKLIILVIITSLTGASSLFINDFMMRPVQKIRNEQTILETLSFRLIDYIAEVNKLNNEKYVDQISLVMEKQRELNSQIDLIRKLTLIPSLNDSTKTSIKNIQMLGDQLKMSQSTLESRIDRVKKTAEERLENNQDYSLYSLSWEMDLEEQDAKQIHQEVSFLISTISTLNENMTNTQTQINDQYTIIMDEVAKYQKRAQNLTGMILVFVFIIPFSIALFIANMIAARIKKIDIGILEMKTGNLCDRIDVKSRDEMGHLSQNINDFTDTLSGSIQKIKDASKRNLKLKEILATSVQNVSERSSEVNLSIQAISTEMNELGGTVQKTSDIVNAVETQLYTLDDVQRDQIGMIEEISAAITEMIASISSVSEITQKKKAALANLVQVSREGGAKLEVTNQGIKRIHDNLSEIQSTASIIQDIAESTNLLAMNAAIEASHAGSAGKGFAVVAGEIRKLAEATSQNSNNISQIMDGIASNIKEAVSSGTNTQKAFNLIDKEVQETSDSFDEIAGNMNELQTGSTQIRVSMSRLTKISDQVNDIRAAIWNAAGDNKTSVGQVEKISGTTIGKVQEISDTLSMLIQEMNSVTEVTRQSEKISNTLEEETSTFTITEKIIDEQG